MKLQVPKKRIEVLENFSHGGHTYYGGEVRFVSEEDAQVACGAGWAKDLDGVIATGERDPTAKRLEIQPLSQDHAATDVKGVSHD